MRSLLTALVLLAVPFAASAEQGGIEVTNVWSRAAMAGRTGVVYLTINDTGVADRLTGASSPVAAKTSLHESFDDHGVMKMRPVAALPVQPGKPVTLAPGGYHIMLEGLTQPLREGETFPVTLNFAAAGPVTATASVQKAGAGMMMQHGAKGGMEMHGGAHGTSMPDMNMPGMNKSGTPQH